MQSKSVLNYLLISTLSNVHCTYIYQVVQRKVYDQVGSLNQPIDRLYSFSLPIYRQFFLTNTLLKLIGKQLK